METFCHIFLLSLLSVKTFDDQPSSSLLLTTIRKTQMAKLCMVTTWHPSSDKKKKRMYSLNCFLFRLQEWIFIYSINYWASWCIRQNALPLEAVSLLRASLQNIYSCMCGRVASIKDGLPVMFTSRYSHLCVAPSHSVSGLVWIWQKWWYVTLKAQLLKKKTWWLCLATHRNCKIINLIVSSH